MKTAQPPKAGWGILEPDPELSPETLELVAKLRALPEGQKHALLTRAVPRYVAVEMALEDREPDRTEMVTCSGALSNFFFDIVGAP